MNFTPTADRLIPDLDPREQIVMLARTLWHEGYRDHLAGHITYSPGDGTLLCNPWLLTWEEIYPEDILRIDLEGNVLEGKWPVPLGIALHLALHRARPDVTFAVHNHSEYGTVWGDLLEVPPAYDQSSSLGGGELVLVDEYDGAVNSMEAATKAVASIGSADRALLGGHGVFVIADTAAAAFLRAVALEQRCKNAWMVRVAGGPEKTSLPDWWLDRQANSDGNGYHGFWEAAVRAQLRADPALADIIVDRSR
ncbi:class II aldolase/adducin family protein [Nocardia vermiculata]|uniref:Class II aldolase/adducin family protein n=1 Tax=Nocardia vermiculata TaxID=257274 RepID=A0A846XW84_9NOCA|nr:class II aldolase/adducin family protein [Nocardia vermiculata]NKY49651.1 class II aldolase/adducin family protein [Nocardia vermiculata]